ncbi:MAG: hypothetical protein L6435_14125 [Anaerolineae bacterium]|nr:hypothetical protein [Anaerolineae bacterium]
MKRPTKGMLLAGLCLLMTLFAYQAHAQVPSIPHAFYGVVQVNGEPAPVGTQVEARGTGVRTGIEGNPITVTEAGRYGGPGGFDPRLVVQGTIEDGTPTEFYVNGIRAQCAEPGGQWLDSYPFKSGGITELNLRVESALTPTREPTLEPTATVALTPTREPTLEPTATVVLTPTREPTLEPTATEVVTPTSEPTSEPTSAVMAMATSEPTSEPTSTVALTLTPEPTAYHQAAVASPTPESKPVSGDGSFAFVLYGLLFVAAVVVVIWVRSRG